MEARVTKFIDPRVEDSDRQPRLSLWFAGNECAYLCAVVENYCDEAVTCTITKPNGDTQGLSVFLKSVKFGQGKSAVAEMAVELAGPLELHIGEIVQVSFG